jgi:two-component system alkaline phosphatase synthesis response regulator PhoP
MANKRSILVVDDEVNVAETIKMVLEQEGYRVTTAYTAAAAIAALQAAKFSAVITDLNMERMDVGLEVARAAQAQKQRPLIVVCTGYPSVQNLHSAFDLHIDYVAIKPCDISDLLLAIHRLFAAREAIKRKKEVPGLHIARPIAS